MKKFAFTLDHVRSYRDRILDEEKNALMKLQAEKAEIDEQIRYLEEEFCRLSREMLEMQDEGTTAYELQIHNNQMMNIRRQVEYFRKEQQKAAAKIDQQMTVVIAASQEVSKLEKLEERQLEMYHIAEGKEEEARIDELITTRIGHRQIG